MSGSDGGGPGTPSFILGYYAMAFSGLIKVDTIFISGAEHFRYILNEKYVFPCVLQEVLINHLTANPSCMPTACKALWLWKHLTLSSVVHKDERSHLPPDL